MDLAVSDINPEARAAALARGAIPPRGARGPGALLPPRWPAPGCGHRPRGQYLVLPPLVRTTESKRRPMESKLRPSAAPISCAQYKHTLGAPISCTCHLHPSAAPITCIHQVHPSAAPISCAHQLPLYIPLYWPNTRRCARALPDRFTNSREHIFPCCSP